MKKLRRIVYVHRVILVTTGLLLTACATSKPDVALDIEPIIRPNNSLVNYQVVSERKLNADGLDKGLDSYQLIKHFAGEKSIESPDLYHNNHPEKRHIYEATDDIVGDHFVFTLHKDHDRDRDVASIKDRQRNEIKGYDGSSRDLKAFKHDIFVYSWKFKLNQDITLSKNFAHFFQLKAVDGGEGAPILTISGRDNKGEWLEVIHRIHGETAKLKKIPLRPFKGRWLQIDCFVDYRNNGQLTLHITDIVNKQRLLDLSLNELDMLRGESSGDFVRPKWGIYRSLRSQDMLRADEEKVFFADFIVQRLRQFEQ